MGSQELLRRAVSSDQFLRAWDGRDAGLLEIARIGCWQPRRLNFGMPGWKHFEEIVAWQLAEQLKLRVYLFIAKPDVRQKYSFCDQLRDAARSAPSNIAEGFGRFGNKEFARFARIAKASEVEVLNHFIDAKDQQLKIHRGRQRGRATSPRNATHRTYSR